MRSSVGMNYLFILLAVNLFYLAVNVNSVKILNPSSEETLVNDLLTGYNALILPTPNNSFSVKVLFNDNRILINNIIRNLDRCLTPSIFSGIIFLFKGHIWVIICTAPSYQRAASGDEIKCLA